MKPPTLDPRLNERLKEAERRFEELDAELISPEVLKSPQRLRELGQERSRLEEIVGLGRKLGRATQELEGALELVQDSTDDELQGLAEAECTDLQQLIEKLLLDLREVLIPKDPLSDRAAVVEIRAGTGGDEAGLFAADLMRMYRRLAERQGWSIELMNHSEGIPGSIKAVIFTVRGKGVYGRLRYESGVHRVQRVPETESQGRIHTSAATVAVLPEAEEVDLQIDSNDLRIDVFRSSGPGGQSVNTTDSAVRITHIPTGLVVSCQDEKSQHKNKAKALKILRARLYESERLKKEKERSSDRKSQIGSGDRSERIRTYNFPQGRVTDHRVNLTLHKLDEFLKGEIHEEMNENLRLKDQDLKLKNLI